MSKKYLNNKPLPDKTELKNYTIIKAIDEGGYSIVYYAYDRKMDKYVAIKEFMPSALSLRKEGNEVIITDKDTLKIYNILLSMFFDEIQMINKINHPNIVKAIDYFTANNTAYLVTPYEVGESLSSYITHIQLQRKTMPEKDVFHITSGLIKAIQEMHRNGILHLDIKPNNIWLRPNKDVVLLDFGTALPENQHRNLMVYTGGFAAIELYSNSVLSNKEQTKQQKQQMSAFYETQAKINASHNNVVGKWTDYYAIGATIYNMLTLKIPPISYELYQVGQQINTNEMNGTTHVKLIDTINHLCQHDISARKTINLQDVLNTLKNATPYPKFNIDLADIIANRPSYVMKPLTI